MHCLVLGVTLMLAATVTAGYVVACNNLHREVSGQVQSKLNENPYDTRGEEIKTRSVMISFFEESFNMVCRMYVRYIIDHQGKKNIRN